MNECIVSNTFMNLKNFQKELRAKANPAKAKTFAGFFKTGRGEYGEGDVFLGITVPDQRKIAAKFPHLTLAELKELLRSRVHEHRFSALEVLVMQYEKATERRKGEIARFYIKNAKRVNNWDLVDTSAPYIPGNHLLNRSKKILYHFAKSSNVWKRRIAIISTHAFIRENRFDDTLALAALLLDDKHDLIHKAVGWMLREVGKRSLKTEENFLKQYAHRMPRTMLRYAIERFPQAKRMRYLTRT